jgi:prepilin-type N-terminal cleavage/methylation domain-containing protein
LFKRRGQKGFTLVELLLVVAIIGILAAVAIPRFNPDTKTAKINKIKATLGNVETAAELYKVNKGSYPAALSDIAVGTDATLKRPPINEFGGTYQLESGTGIAQFKDTANATFHLGMADWSAIQLN